MEIPKDIEVLETKTSFIWRDPSGIICSITKENTPSLSDQENEKEMERFYNFFGRDKLCFLIDVKHAKPNSPSERKRSGKILNEITLAMALIIYNPLGRMLINLFVGLQKPPYPMKIFKPGEEALAKEWLIKFLKT